jgi:hypothetical protein
MSGNVSKASKPKRNRENKYFAKRLKSLLEKSNGLVEYHAGVYLLDMRRGKVWEYNSVKCACWPLSAREVVRSPTKALIGQD